MGESLWSRSSWWVGKGRDDSVGSANLGLMRTIEILLNIHIISSDVSVIIQRILRARKACVRELVRILIHVYIIVSKDPFIILT